MAYAPQTNNKLKNDLNLCITGSLCHRLFVFFFFFTPVNITAEKCSPVIHQRTTEKKSVKHEQETENVE